MKEIKQPNETCEKEGHDFEFYAFHSEQAGLCIRCGFDTHEGI